MTISQALQLGIQHQRSGRLREAEGVYRQVLAAQPNQPDALYLLGTLAQNVGRLDLAADLIRQAIALNPAGLHYHIDLGTILSAQGKLDEGIAEYRRYLEADPNFATAHSNLGVTLKSKGLRDEAIAEFRRAIELDPNLPQAHNNLGIALRESWQLDEAVAAYRRAIELKPDYPEAHNNLAVVLRERGENEAAVAALHQALYHGGPCAEVQSNLIFSLHYLPGDQFRREIAEEIRRWNQQYAAPLKQFIRPPTNDRNPNRRLRIGYVAMDFRDHVLGRNLLPLFKSHDHQDFEIRCYAGVSHPDAVTEEFRQHADRWCNISRMRDGELAETIRADGVDVLVDLAQHMAGNRLSLFALQPAPVQVSFAGYPESAGLETIDYRITGQWLEGEMQDAGFKIQDELVPSAPPASRRLHPGSGIFLVDTFWCYDPCGLEMAVSPLPAATAGKVTFGCLNSYSKINDRVLGLWGRVLRQVPNSRLLLLSANGSHRQRAVGVLGDEGIASHRVEFFEPVPRRQYLELYHRVDVALDPFPYNGHTTSLDALWMGVPLVTLAGDTPVSRGGLSTLNSLGVPEWIAHSEEEYVTIAAGLASDLPRLAEWRSTLRKRMEASPLMDAPRFALQIEHAYREMWRDWCQRPS